MSESQETRKRHRCEVQGERFVEPCWVLDEMAQSSGKGINIWRAVGPAGPSRTFMTLHSGKHAKKGVAMNYCPFCGTDISAPLRARQALASKDSPQ